MEHYELIRTSRKTLALELADDGRVLVRAPMRLPAVAIDAFVAEHADWIARHKEQQRQRSVDIPDSPEDIAVLKAKARTVLPPLVEHWSRIMGVTPAGLKITSARKRYGSCSGKNVLCFSCFLMCSPPEGIELVVVHELCHILEKNHGPGFYALLRRYLPDYQERKQQLKSLQ